MSGSSADKFRSGTSREASLEYATAMVDLVNALEEWKSAGADVLTVVRAIQRFVHAIGAQREIANGEHLATLSS